MTNSEKIQPFTVDVPQSDLDDLRNRLERTRFAEELPAAGSSYGVPVDPVHDLVSHWLTGFDWRAKEAELNAVPQFTTEIDGQNVHFLHVRSPEPGATPLLLTHGWPATPAEFLPVVGPLTDPGAHGGDASDAFHLVVPSLPGFGFSGPTRERGWTRFRVARAWIELMDRLGYARFGVGGNDVGAMVSPEVGRFAPDRVLGVHVTQVFAFPSGDPEEFASLSPEDLGAVQYMQEFMETKGAFNVLQSSAPQTLAHALADSPAGQLAWSLQLMEGLDRDEILTHVATYWLTNTAASSARSYYEDAHTEESYTEPTTAPLGHAGFAGDFRSVRAFAERDHSAITSWNTYDRGGHFSASGAPDLLVDDIRAFFRGLH
ncbi:epoxide hydrolase family protein [Nocardiopsis oceani]